VAKILGVVMTYLSYIKNLNFEPVTLKHHSGADWFFEKDGVTVDGKKVQYEDLNQETLGDCVLMIGVFVMSKQFVDMEEDDD
jgi:hypothetical protein